jgi:hypothetical protein
MVKAIRASETLVYFYDNTRRYIPEICYLHTVILSPDASLIREVFPEALQPTLSLVLLFIEVP